MNNYDVMQVCRNGHRITDSFHEFPAERQNACAKCGGETIHECEECNTPIRGHNNTEGVILARAAPVPDFCQECGEPYPWTSTPHEFEELDSSTIDSELQERAHPEFADGHYQAAVRTAFTVLEERIRKKGGFPPHLTGAKLALEAFNSEKGPLAFGETGGEKDGVMFLYRGAFQALRNPPNHRFIEPDRQYAHDAICSVNLLLRLLENGEAKD